MQIKIPLAIELPRKKTRPKKVILNLNVYRNLHHATNGEVKIEFTKLMKEQLERLVFPEPLELHYTIFRPTNRRMDTMNPGSVIDKFFCDALVHYGCISDDNDSVIVKTTFQSGGKVEDACAVVDIVPFRG